MSLLRRPLPMWFVWLALALGAWRAEAAWAQTPWGAAAELAVGGAHTAARTFRPVTKVIARGSIGIRHRVSARSFAFGEIDREKAARFPEGDKVDVACFPNPTGSYCEGPEPPNVTTTSLVFGIGFQPIERLELRGDIGAGVVRGDEPGVPTLGAFVGGIAATVDPLPHVGLTLSVRQTAFRINGALLTLTPITIGLRVH